MRGREYRSPATRVETSYLTAVRRGSTWRGSCRSSLWKRPGRIGDESFRSGCAQLVGSQFGVQCPAEPRDDPGYRLDVSDTGVEVHDARAQRVAAADDGVRDECLAAALDAMEQALVQRVEMPLDRGVAQLRSQ